MGTPLKLAITGCMGSGKSVVSRIMEIMGVPVYDCDARAKELMVSDAAIVKELKRMFGNECYCEDGTLNRNYVASCIFTDSDNIKRVNALVHPVVCRDVGQWAARQDVPVVAVETAILYESGMIECIDKVVAVWSGRETAVRRTMKRSGMSRRQVEDRLAKQMSVDELILLTDYSLYNDEDKPLLPEIIELLNQLKDA